MDIATLQFLWYIVFAASMFAYAALDGFDIGVGVLHIFAKNDTERRIFMNSIGPVWDSNSLWVIISSGALLAGFPAAFATLFSALYLPIMVLIFGYIMRGVAIEFRSQLPHSRWRNFWDWVFSLASLLLAVGFGIVLANLIRGIPLDDNGVLVRDHLTLLSPYAVLLGIFTTILFMLHGALYLYLKTEGELQEKIHHWCWRLFGIFTFFWVIVNIDTPLMQGQVTKLLRMHGWLTPLVLVGLFGVMGIFAALSRRYVGWAFISSCLVIFSLIVSYAIGTFPNIVRSSLHPDINSLTIYNASSTAFTLKILMSIALIGVPLFFVYAFYTYRVFRGKVELDQMSY